MSAHLDSISGSAVTEARVGPTFAYVLATAAYNEEKYIERTIQSVIFRQTVQPQKWIIGAQRRFFRQHR